MERIVIALVLVVVAVAVAAVVDRRRPDAPTQPRSWAVPAQLDRRDFVEPGARWLVVVFSSATCDSCSDTVAKAGVLAGEDVAVEDVEVGASPDRHARYGIDAVPVVVIADAEGVVRSSFVGPPSAADLWAAMARAREGGAPETPPS